MTLISLISRILPRKRTFVDMIGLPQQDTAIRKHSTGKLLWPMQRVKLGQNAMFKLVIHDTDNDKYYVLGPGNERFIPAGGLRRHQFEFFLISLQSLKKYSQTIEPASTISDSLYSGVFRLPSQILRNLNNGINGETQNVETVQTNDHLQRKVSIHLQYRLKVSNASVFCITFKPGKMGDSRNYDWIHNKIQDRIYSLAYTWIEENINSFRGYKVGDKMLAQLRTLINQDFIRDGLEIVDLSLFIKPGAVQDETLVDNLGACLENISASLCQAINASVEHLEREQRQQDIDWTRIMIQRILEDNNIEYLANNPGELDRLLEERL